MGESNPSFCLRLDGDFARSFTADDLLIPTGDLPLAVGIADLVAMLDFVGVRSGSTSGLERDRSRVTGAGIDDADGIGESANPTCRWSTLDNILSVSVSSTE